MAKKSPAGWIILILVLALPGVIFYFGWVRLREKRVSRRFGARPPLGQVFNSAPPGVRVLNSIPVKLAVPVAQTATQSSAAAKALLTSLPHSSASPQSPQAAVPAGLPASQSRNISNIAKSVSKTPPVSAPSTSVAMSSQNQKLTIPQLKRDPTLSPADRKEIYDILHPKPKPKPKIVHYRPKKKKGPPIESLIDLEGIIFVSPVNAKAIINGNIMKVGELVHGAKIVKIEKKKVTFSYRGRRIIKAMSSKF